MSAIKRIVLVGHCGFDSSTIQDAVQHAAPGVAIEHARSDEELKAMGPDSLLLINRQLGWGFGTDSGVDLIREIAEHTGERKPAMMLVSNYDDAQAAAVAAGAQRGFGKSEIGTGRVRDLIRGAVFGEAAAGEARS